jgi:GH24 family phage-related lysozyme (muramidase)
MVQVVGKRIIGGIGAPGGGMSDAFGAGVNTALGQRQTRQAMDERAQLMQQRGVQFQQGQEDRARTAAAFDAFGASLTPPPTDGVDVGGMFAAPGVAPAGYRLGAPGDQMPVPRTTGAPNLTFGLIQGFEGFRDTPYWDVNAFRTGFGSDTVTLADGSVVPVRQGMRVSREDAERDLIRRVNTEFAPRAAQQVGAVWDSLPEHVSAPLVSIAYNYGSLPGNVAEAAKTGDPELIARAIEARAGDNGGINAARRRQEAAIVRSGGQIDPGLMRAATAPTGQERGSRIPDQSMRFARAGLNLPTFDATGAMRLSANADLSARPGNYQAAATAQRAAEYVPPPDTDSFWWLRMDPNAPSGEAAQRILFPQADPMEIRRRLLAEQAAAETATTAPPAPVEPQVEVQTPGLDTPRPRPRPEMTFEQSEDALIAAEQAAGATAPAAGVTVPTAGATAPAAGATAPAAGVVQPSATTADVMQGANVNSVPDDFPGLGALFRDTAALAVERQNLDALAAALMRQMEFARQTRDAGLMLEADSKLAAINSRRSVMGYIAAGNAAMTGNFDPMAQALSEMSGQSIEITPRSGGTYDLSVDGQVVREGLAGDAMIQQYMYGVNDTYRATVDAARVAEAERAKAYFDAQIEMLIAESAQNAQAGREAYVKAVEAEIASMGSEFYSERIPYLDGEAIVLYDRKNPSAPVRVISVLPDPANPEATILGQINVNDLRR